YRRRRREPLAPVVVLRRPAPLGTRRAVSLHPDHPALAQRERPPEERLMTATARPTPARHATIATPPGPFTVVVDADDVVLASGWTADVADLLPVIHPTLRPAASELVDDLPVLDVVGKFVAGDVTAIDGVPVRQRSGPFLTEA